MIKKEPEEEIIFNDDYNYLPQEIKLNGKEKNVKETNDKMLVIKEKEITPIIRRQIKAEVVRIKDDLSETSEQSDVDVLGGIQMRRTTTAYSMGRLSSSSGYKTDVLSGEVIFTPKINFGMNIIDSNYKKEILNKRGLNLYNGIENEKISEIAINGNNKKLYNYSYNGYGGTTNRSFKNKKRNKIEIIKRGFNSTNKFYTIYKSTSNINNNKLSKIPHDSKKKYTKKQIIIKSKVNAGNNNGAINDENLNSNQIISNDNFNKASRKIIFNTHLSKRQIKHSASTIEIRNRNKKIISIQKAQ